MISLCTQCGNYTVRLDMGVDKFTALPRTEQIRLLRVALDQMIRAQAEDTICSNNNEQLSMAR
jgi:hypothetical protein